MESDFSSKSREVEEEVVEETRRRRRHVEEIEERMLGLYRDLMKSVTDIQTAADAEQSCRRAALQEANRLRSGRLENEQKSCQEKCEDMSRGWTTAKERTTSQEVQDVLDSQQLLCAELVEEKGKVIGCLQELLQDRNRDNVKALKNQAKEVDAMIETTKDQIQTLTKAYREELGQFGRAYRRECDVSRLRHKSEWDGYIGTLRVSQLKSLKQRREKVQEYERSLGELQAENDKKYNVEVRETQQRKLRDMRVPIVAAKTRSKILKHEKQEHSVQLTQMTDRMEYLQDKLKNLRVGSSRLTKWRNKRQQCLTADFKRTVQQHDCLHRKVKHFAAVDAKRLKDMRLMIEGDVAHLAERALDIDFQIRKHLLGVSWEGRCMLSVGASGLIQPQKRTQVATERQAVEMAQSRSVVRTAEENIAEDDGKSEKTTNWLLELLFDEAEFLAGGQLMLPSLQDEAERTVMKLESVFFALGIKDVGDVHKLTAFLLEYAHQQGEQNDSDKTEGEESSSGTDLTCGPLHPNHVLPALKLFIEQQRSAPQPSAAARDAPDEAGWQSLANFLPGDKLELWTALEDILTKHHKVLTEMSHYIAETRGLQQQNAELRLLLQQSLTSSNVPRK